MNLQCLIVVVLRLLALDFLLRVAVQVTPQILNILRAYERSPLDGPQSFLVLPWLMLVGLIVSAALLWAFALPIARLVTRGVSHDFSFGAMSLVDCYSIAFMAVGLFYVASHLPQALNWAHYLFKLVGSRSGSSWKEGVNGYEVLQIYLPFVLGVVLFVNGRAWAVALARRQEKSGSANQTSEPTSAPPFTSDPQ